MAMVLDFDLNLQSQAVKHKCSTKNNLPPPEMKMDSIDIGGTNFVVLKVEVGPGSLIVNKVGESKDVLLETQILVYEYMENISHSNLEVTAWTQANSTDNVALSKKPSSKKKKQ